MKSESERIDIIRRLAFCTVAASPRLRAVQDALRLLPVVSSSFEAWLRTVFPPEREQEKFLPTRLLERSYRAFSRVHPTAERLSRPAFYRELKKRLRKGKTRYPPKTGDYAEGWWG
jgi:hypothetical protein